MAFEDDFFRESVEFSCQVSTMICIDHIARTDRLRILAEVISWFLRQMRSGPDVSQVKYFLSYLTEDDNLESLRSDMRASTSFTL